MPTGTTPNYATTPKTYLASVGTAETSLTAPTNVATLATGGASGSRIDFIRIKATGTTTAGIVRLWIHDGSSYFLFREVAVTAITASSSVPSFFAELDLRGAPILLATSSYTLRVSTEKSETFKIAAFGGEF